MKIVHLDVSGFRNIENASIDPGKSFNLFIGPNGQGKTNLLEALFGSLRGKSFRPYTSKKDWLPVPLETSVPTRVAVQLEDARGWKLDCRVERNAQQKWDFFFNDKRATPAKIRQHVPVVIFSPDDHALIRGAPDLRRDFLDEIFTDICPGYGEVSERFERALKSRNRVLRTVDWDSQTLSELKAWTHLLAETSAELSQLRWEVWASFETRFLAIGRNLFEEFGTRLKITFDPDLKLKTGESYTSAGYLKHIEDAMHKDRATGWSHHGPQRDDFSIFLDGIDSRTSASQGQARLLALQLKWLHAEWVKEERGELPIFLIDDLSSELDAERRHRLLNLVGALSGQVFVTSTEASWVDSGPFSDYTCFLVKQGVFSTQKTSQLKL